MRLLVACPDCQRQYDASGRPVGSRLRCHCGHVIVVQQPQGHEAEVVRCSACGAARTENAERCPYCQAEFTLQERDLNTVCPHCLALVSDKARFCHHCGAGLVPELDAGAPTKLLCPACGDGHLLVSRRLGTEQVTVLECGCCAGFWMGHEAFRQLVERAQREALPAGTIVERPQQISAKFGLPSGSVAPSPTHRHVAYRPCPVCSELMNRTNYGHESGVIIDVCRDHGIWFDADELARILAWLRAGGGRSPAREIPLFQPPQRPLPHTPLAPISRPSFMEALLDFLLGSRDEGTL
ncbi:MAG TPA: zinc ribbon domain-containing protein [Gemmataceae bacterium]|nr:zinc ribbon domain-containing protein [Gemmataceae bacterium]